MNANEPVAWMSNDSFEISTMQSDKFSIPLYTHPVKELTDEEIDEISKEVWERPWLEVHRKFARAILRKAQEK